MGPSVILQNVESDPLPNARICVVDDDHELRESLALMLRSRGYTVQTFSSAAEFLDGAPGVLFGVDLIISDISMPERSGFELCRGVRAMEPEGRIPVVLVTGNLGIEGRRLGLELGADDILEKPFRSKELLAKLRSLLEIRAEQKRRAAELSLAHDEKLFLERQLHEIEEKTRGFELLKNFVSPRVVKLAQTDSSLFQIHQRDVTVVFADLRGFTAFAEGASPAEVLRVLEGYYAAVGGLAIHHGGTIGHLAGDGIMVFFNDPVPVAGHSSVALRMALETRDALNVLKEGWRAQGHALNFGIGLAAGRATIGGLGFGEFRQYTVVGTVANLAARLCQAAQGEEVLVSGAFLAELPDMFRSTAVGKVDMKGLRDPVEVFNVLSPQVVEPDR